MKALSPALTQFVQHCLRYQRLDCLLCQTLYQQGDLAEYPCNLCITPRYEALDAADQQAVEAYMLFRASMLDDRVDALRMVFGLVDVRIPSAAATKLYWKLCGIHRLVQSSNLEVPSKHGQDLPHVPGVPA